MICHGNKKYSLIIITSLIEAWLNHQLHSPCQSSSREAGFDGITSFFVIINRLNPSPSQDDQDMKNIRDLIPRDHLNNVQNRRKRPLLLWSAKLVMSTLICSHFLRTNQRLRQLEYRWRLLTQNALSDIFLLHLLLCLEERSKEMFDFRTTGRYSWLQLLD